MSTEAFDGQSLTEKLSKLNNSQQSIESLSRWCITHRKKAKQIVETWDQIFNSSQKEQRVSFLYLANDILQNSRRKGSEFVNEFWKFLPAALKHVYGNGDEGGKRVVSRLVGIWEERKVFGSRGQSLKDVMTGNEKDLSIPVSNGKSSNPIKIMKRDAHSIRIKLAVGGMPEKVLMAFQAVLDENVNEEAILSKCSSTVERIGEIENCDNTSNPEGEQQGYALADEINEQESVLKQCVKELESVEDSRSVLVSLLREALQDQESKLKVIHAQLQVARGRIERASNKRKRATLSPVSGSPGVASDQQAPSILPQPPSAQPVTSFVPVQITEEEKKKAAAAAMAAKLAASTSSAQMLTSVLSSLVAEEAANMNSGLQPPGFGFPMFSPDKRAKLEKPMSVSDVSHSDSVNTSFMQIQTSMQTMSQPSHLQAPFQPPPPGLLTLSNSQSNQFVQSAGMMVGVMPYGFGANNTLPPPPPPPLPPHIAMGLARPAPQQSASQSPQSQQQQQQPATGGYYRPPGIGFYGQNHQSATNEFRS